MNAYFAFTDECGVYEKIRGERFLKNNPFYVRSTVIISLEDYLKLQEEMDKIKLSIGLNPNIEIKWSHYGSIIKNNYSKIPHNLTQKQVEEYFKRILSFFIELKSVEIYYTFTKNDAIGRIDQVALIKMHLQNALQRIQTTMAEKEGFAIVIADDLNDKTKTLKNAMYKLTMEGDYVSYTNIKKGLYVDFSNQCHGLQIADICAGVFTATLKYETANEKDKCKFKFGRELYTRYTSLKTRHGFYHPPTFEVYKFGIKEVPQDNKKGQEIAIQMSNLTAECLEDDLQKFMIENYG